MAKIPPVKIIKDFWKNIWFKCYPKFFENIFLFSAKMQLILFFVGTLPQNKAIFPKSERLSTTNIILIFVTSTLLKDKVEKVKNISLEGVAILPSLSPDVIAMAGSDIRLSCYVHNIQNKTVRRYLSYFSIL